MRTFIAIDLPKEVSKELEDIQRKLPEAKMNLVSAENIHLTMKFLGELTDDEANKVKEVLKKLEFKRFKARIGSLGIFPNPSFIRVVWVGIEPKEKIMEIHDKLDEELSKEKFRKDKAFESHATIARVKWLKDKKSFIDELQKIKIKPIEFEVSSIALKKSTLT
ncbi:unnamed protein product, partial [marine sediment metagenome]